MLSVSHGLLKTRAPPGSNQSFRQAVEHKDGKDINLQKRLKSRVLLWSTWFCTSMPFGNKLRKIECPYPGRLVLIRHHDIQLGKVSGESDTPGYWALVHRDSMDITMDGKLLHRRQSAFVIAAWNHVWSRAAQRRYCSLRILPIPDLPGLYTACPLLMQTSTLLSSIGP